MTNKRKPTTTKGRLDAIELALKPQANPLIVVFQSRDNPDLFYISGNPGELMTKQEALDKLENDYTIIMVTYNVKIAPDLDLVS